MIFVDYLKVNNNILKYFAAKTLFIFNEYTLYSVLIYYNFSQLIFCLISLIHSIVLKVFINFNIYWHIINY